MGTSWGGLERRRDTAGPAMLDCGPQRDGEGELLPAPALFADAPDRRLVKGGGMREFTDKIFHRSRKRTDASQGDGAIFFSGT